ncbi:hypothetical protein PV371_37200 [Streptomyces sp. TX20-6-3]|uniref:hypothetical protein n=1 Tax=Streptomyces sp. TX20-6-3 TaxID=3028705 RepID=UPI0029A5174D|nr:hypothetical protein [Streptomyces sp. TX20-6-3]MDX2565244.1 hypothetical protein [Streptomyces sp. TX20-6-3]
MAELMARPNVSLRSVGAELELSFSTVQDIMKGYSGSGSKRPRNPKEERPAPARARAGGRPPGTVTLCATKSMHGGLKWAHLPVDVHL